MSENLGILEILQIVMTGQRTPQQIPIFVLSKPLTEESSHNDKNHTSVLGLNYLPKLANKN